VPRVKNGPVGVHILPKLGGTKKARKGGNKTQAIVLHLISRLPKLSPGFSYHVYLNNLFVSTKFVEYAYIQGIIITGICRDIEGVIQELLNLKKSDKKDIIKWGTTYSMPTKTGKVC
jgi:hypothetical protein